MVKRIVMVWLLLILTAPGVHSQERETVSAKEVLDRMVSVYGSCNSYMDKGQVKYLFSRGNRVVIRPFTTAFVRPSRFRFEFTEESNLGNTTYVVWRDGASIRSWWSLNPQTRHFETLGLAVAGATGVSGGSAIVVPSMLFQNLGDAGRVQLLTELSLVREEEVRGRAAYRIQGKDWMNNWVSIWIDKQTFLLVKLFEKRSGKVDVKKTIQYEPQVNVDVPPDKLVFKH